MARHSGTSLCLQLVAIGCGFLFAVAAARLLGPSGYGLVAFALSVSNIVATLALLGTNALAAREVGSSAAKCDWSRLRAFVRWAASTTAVTLTFGALAVGLVSLVAGPYRSVLLIGSLGVPLLGGLLLLRGINQGARRIVAAQFPMDVGRWAITLSVVGYVFAAHIRATPAQIVAVVLLSNAVSLAMASVVLRRHLRTLPSTQAQQASFGGWLAASLPFLTVALLGITATEMNTLLLGSISGPREAGLYQPLARLAPLMLIAKDAIEMPLAPRIAAMWQAGDHDNLAQLIRRSTIASTLATTFVAGAILAASPLIFGAFGPDFETVRGYLFWIAAAQIGNTAFGPSPLLLAMAGDMRRRIQAQALTLAVQAVLTTALVPAFGVEGAVIALSVQMLAWSATHWLLAKHATGINTSVVYAISIGLQRRQEN
jgi:O-antigen/teichoic acid export membrane protein